MKLIKHYGYREAIVSAPYQQQVSWGEECGFGHSSNPEKVREVGLDHATVGREFVEGLELALNTLAGLKRWERDNHTTFVYEDDSGVERAVWFHDHNAIFGFAGDVSHYS